MQIRRSDIFTTIRTEGSILPADLLQRIAEGDPRLEGLTPEDYHLAGNEKLNEAANRSWNRLLGAWLAFKDAAQKLCPDDPGTSVTRERWLLILFQELGYGRLQSARAVEIDGKTYPISHFWQHVPIHLVGQGTPLDRRTAGVAGAARTSPHSLVQEYLNRSDASLWGMVSNGLKLRLLRDNVSLTRQAYVEFDLESMMNGEVYSDFALLWLLCHQSRFEGEKPESCRLEKWSRFAQDQGTRALDQLRDGVAQAIEALGRGFLHKGNVALRDRLRTGALDKQDYYRELLRLVYRLLFLFVAEDRNLLMDPDAGMLARQRYVRFYSTARLRRLAEKRRGSRHTDLFEALRVVMAKLGADEGCPELGLPALGSFLFSAQAISNLEFSIISNDDFLDAIRALAITLEGKVIRLIDFKNLGSEELGSVYESLLELHPELNLDAGTFSLSTAGGHERKTTGSYYTPTSLITCLLDSALDPVVDEACKKSAPEKALLDLRICDPACGSGHFLIAAAHRIAKRLGAIRTGDEEPAPDAVRTALRDVIGHCIYGVDVNEMAVELCQVALWMEALDPGKPLSFLDHRIHCGNSLLGTTPALMEAGIPDEAFMPIEGDDKSFASSLKRKNREERAGQMALPLVAEPIAAYGDVSEEITSLDNVEDSSIAGIHEKQARYRRLSESPEYRRAQLAADAWCAAFVWRKTKSAPEAVTHDVLRRLMSNPERVARDTREEIARLAAQFNFFHWHLAFPDIFRVPEKLAGAENPNAYWNGGFDVVLGNPPWDTLSPDSKEFFSAYDPQIRLQEKAGQDRIIAGLFQDPVVANAWEASCRFLYSQVHFFKQSGRYELFAPGNLGKGDFNVYRMFVETALRIARNGGFVAQIVPENLYNGANAAAIRKHLLSKCEWTVLLGFQNLERQWFPSIYYRMRFCLYAARIGKVTSALRTFFGIVSETQIEDVKRGRWMSISPGIIEEFSPDALAISEFQNQREIDIATKMYALWPKFGDQNAGPPQRHYMREIDMGTDRELFSEDPSGLPLYEGRMVDAFDHRAKAYCSGRGRAAEWPELRFGDFEKAIRPQWHVLESALPEKLGDRPRCYRIGFCDVASPTNERTLVAALIPPNTVCGDKVPTITFEDGYGWAYMVWLAVANSFGMDFIARKKVSLKMSYTVLDSLPFPRVSPDHEQARRIIDLAARLTCTGPEMRGYWDILAQDGWLPSLAPSDPLPGIADETKREQARAELDAVVARDLFGLTREELDYVMDTFPIVRRRDEEKYGEYRTKRLILELYDDMSAAIPSGRACQTLVNPSADRPPVVHHSQHPKNNYRGIAKPNDSNKP